MVIMHPGIPDEVALYPYAMQFRRLAKRFSRALLRTAKVLWRIVASPKVWVLIYVFTRWVGKEFRKKEQQFGFRERQCLHVLQCAVYMAENVLELKRVEKRTLFEKELKDVIFDEEARRYIIEAARQTTPEEPCLMLFVPRQHRWHILNLLQNQVSSVAAGNYIVFDQRKLENRVHFRSAWYVFTVVCHRQESEGRYLVTPSKKVDEGEDLPVLKLRVVLVHEKVLQGICKGEFRPPTKFFSNRHLGRWKVLTRIADMYHAQFVTLPEAHPEASLEGSLVAPEDYFRTPGLLELGQIPILPDPSASNDGQLQWTTQHGALLETERRHENKLPLMGTFAAIDRVSERGEMRGLKKEEEPEERFSECVRSDADAEPQHSPFPSAPPRNSTLEEGSFTEQRSLGAVGRDHQRRRSLSWPCPLEKTRCNSLVQSTPQLRQQQQQQPAAQTARVYDSMLAYATEHYGRHYSLSSKFTDDKADGRRLSALSVDAQQLTSAGVERDSYPSLSTAANEPNGGNVCGGTVFSFDEDTTNGGHTVISGALQQLSPMRNVEFHRISTRTRPSAVPILSTLVTPEFPSHCVDMSDVSGNDNDNTLHRLSRRPSPSHEQSPPAAEDAYDGDSAISDNTYHRYSGHSSFEANFNCPMKTFPRTDDVHAKSLLAAERPPTELTHRAYLQHHYDHHDHHHHPQLQQQQQQQQQHQQAAQQPPTQRFETHSLFNVCSSTTHSISQSASISAFSSRYYFNVHSNSHNDHGILQAPPNPGGRVFHNSPRMSQTFSIGSNLDASRQLSKHRSPPRKPLSLAEQMHIHVTQHQSFHSKKLHALTPGVASHSSLSLGHTPVSCPGVGSGTLARPCAFCDSPTRIFRLLRLCDFFAKAAEQVESLTILKEKLLQPVMDIVIAILLWNRAEGAHLNWGDVKRCVELCSPEFLDSGREEKEDRPKSNVTQKRCALETKERRDNESGASYVPSNLITHEGFSIVHEESPKRGVWQRLFSRKTGELETTRAVPEAQSFQCSPTNCPPVDTDHTCCRMHIPFPTLKTKVDVEELQEIRRDEEFVLFRIGGD